MAQKRYVHLHSVFVDEIYRKPFSNVWKKSWNIWLTHLQKRRLLSFQWKYFIYIGHFCSSIYKRWVVPWRRPVKLGLGYGESASVPGCTFSFFHSFFPGLWRPGSLFRSTVLCRCDRSLKWSNKNEKVNQDIKAFPGRYKLCLKWTFEVEVTFGYPTFTRLLLKSRLIIRLYSTF